MGEVTLRLQIDRQTGKKNVIISYRSDPGALPLEHEHEHRALVDKLIQGGALRASELGQVVIQRDTTESATTPESATEASSETRVGVSES